MSSVYQRILCMFCPSSWESWHCCARAAIRWKLSLISASSSAFEDWSTVSSQIGLMQLMQYLQKQCANIGFVSLKSQPVVLKGRCLAIESIAIISYQSSIQTSYTDLIAYKLINTSYMFGLLSAIISERLGTPTYNIAILGPQNSKKSLLFTIIKHIDQEDAPINIKTSYKPTVGLNVTYYKHKKDKFKVWDLGGKPGLRKIWESYYSECHGLIFTVDNRINENMTILAEVLSHQEMARIPLVLLLVEPNLRQQVQKCLKGNTSASWLEGRKYVVQEVTVQHLSLSKNTLREILHWLYSSIADLHNSLKD